MKKSSLYFLAGFLIAAGLFGGLWHFRLVPNYLLDAIANRDNTIVNVTGNLPSPNKEYVATTTKVGNGSDWCEVRINVHKYNEQFDWEYEYVCITGCDTQLGFKWENDKNLNINYSSSEFAKGVRTYQQFWSKDNTVKISYTLKQ